MSLCKNMRGPLKINQKAGSDGQDSTTPKTAIRFGTNPNPNPFGQVKGQRQPVKCAKMH